jgi:hypothetical protein
MPIRSAVQRTCVAFAFRLGGAQAFGRPATIHPHLVTTRLFAASTFTPPEPPASRGQPVYSDIDFSVGRDPDSESHRRNTDRDAVFVVNGSSRGIGLQFVKSLLDRTEVCGIILLY